MENLKKRIYLGEDSYTQFKVNITNSDKLAEELVAFSNAKGGLLIIGVDDKAEIVGLSSDDIRRLLKRLFAESKKLYADEEIIKTSEIFMFHNRVEIISPGKLTNSLTIEKIKSGISIHRNPILNSIWGCCINIK
jgi:predicted HTH transcriptional regulator